MTSLPPDRPKRSRQATIGASAALPAGWQLDPQPLSSAVLAQIQALPRPRVSFAAWDELPPRHQSETHASWEGPPTPLASRRIRGPWPDPGRVYEPLLLTLRHSRRDAELSAATRVISEGQHVQRAIVELEATSLEVVDARTLPVLTNRALLAKDGQAWQLLRAVRDNGAEAMRISNSIGTEEVLVLFSETIGKTMHVRDEAVHEIDSHGNARRLCVVESPKPNHEPPAGRSPSAVHTWMTHIAIAVVAALVAHPIVEFTGKMIGIEIALPAAVPALLGLAVGFALARPLTRHVRAYRRILVHVLELPDSQDAIVKRLEELQPNPRPPGD